MYFGDIRAARAHWVTRDTILWGLAAGRDGTYTLHYDLNAGLMNRPEMMTNGHQIQLHYVEAGADPHVYTKFPHLRGLSALKIVPEAIDQVPAALKGQLIVSARSNYGTWVDATGLQVPGVLDDLYTYNGKLGVSHAGSIPTLCLWAPTAQAVTLHLYDDPQTSSASQSIPMLSDPTSGVWSATGVPDWNGKFYLYEVVVFVPRTGKVERNLVTDPYSVSLTANSTRSQIIDLADPSLLPHGWHSFRKPELAAPTDIVLYELHVRDFSINDQTVAAAHRGTYLAFTESQSNGMKHLRGLAEAGLTHIHLLPVFDIATIDEDPAARVEPDAAKLATYPPDSDHQQAAIMAVRDRDGFNWGYDPYHYTVPEGSYSTDAHGPTRIREFREMVQALSDAGLRVIMDVVYNHTHSGGLDEKSVLDKIVPGYYHRLNEAGIIENSTCCANTATEHAMMEKLMIDSLRTWATAYKVDGFRFDLMGHHMVANMIRARDTLAALTLDHDGVDGSKIYLYGEGWNFGEVAYDARGRNATQRNMAGTGIGTFSDRMRDAVRGGSAFSGLQDQGFATGLLTAPNATWQGHHDEQCTRLLAYTDQLRISLAGTLRDYEIDTFYGARIRGEDFQYNGQPTGYVTDPREVINYIEAHDNETFWDAIQLKAASYITLEQRVRMQMLGNSIVCLAQGIPFFQAGQDLLRSKSLDRNSYNSGDWFNKLDFSYETNNWGVGLPPGENWHHWPLMRALLANPALKPGKPEILRSLAHFKEMLQIRKSSKLFRLETAEEIRAKLRFWNTGPSQIPGLIVMHIADHGPRPVDNMYAQIVVLFNALPSDQDIHAPIFANVDLTLHPVQAAATYASGATFDAVTSMFRVPAYTAAVFVERRASALLDRP